MQHEELWITLFGAIATLLGFLKTTDWWQRRIAERKRGLLDQASDALIAGMNQTYQDYVKVEKANSNNNKLEPLAKKHAMDKTLREAELVFENDPIKSKGRLWGVVPKKLARSFVEENLQLIKAKRPLRRLAKTALDILL